MITVLDVSGSAVDNDLPCDVRTAALTDACGADRYGPTNALGTAGAEPYSGADGHARRANGATNARGGPSGGSAPAWLPAPCTLGGSRGGGRGGGGGPLDPPFRVAAPTR